MLFDTPLDSGPVLNNVAPFERDTSICITRVCCAMLVAFLNVFLPMVRSFLLNPKTIGTNRILRFTYLLIGLLCFYLCSVILLMVEYYVQYEASHPLIAYAYVSCFLAITIQLSVFVVFQGKKKIFWPSHIASWAVLCALEACTVIHDFVRLSFSSTPITAWLHICLALSKLFTCLTLLVWAYIYWSPITTTNPASARIYTDYDEEATRGRTDEGDNDESDSESDQDTKTQQEIAKAGGLWRWLKKLRAFWIFIWPVGQPRLQAQLILTIAMANANNVASFAETRVLGKMMNSIQRLTFIWTDFEVWAILEFSSAWILPNVRFLSWFPVSAFRTANRHELTHTKIMNLGPSYHSSNSPTEIMRSVDKAGDIDTFFDVVFFELFPNVLQLGLAISGLITYGPWVTLVVLCVVILAMLLNAIELVLMIPPRETWRATESKQQLFRQNGIRGYLTLANHGRVLFETQKAVEKIEEWMQDWLKYQYFLLKMMDGEVLILQAGFILAHGLIINDIVAGRRLIGDLFIVTRYFLQLQDAAKFLTSFIGNRTETLSDSIDFMKLWELEPGMKDGVKKLKITKGDIVLRNITFSYGIPGGKVLNNFDLDIKGGTKVGIIGESGTGKSTIFQLLMRQQRVPEGEGIVSIDGQDIITVTEETLHANIGRMEQNPYYFNASVQDNIIFVKPTATEEELHQACRHAEIYDVIMKKEQQFDTPMGENGSNFSGGERQRIGLARLFLQNPSIILIDEGTSALDPPTEALIRRSLATVFYGRTIVIIAHRLSNIRDADEIIFLGDDGRILERGTHEQLLANNSYYAKSWRIHIGEECPGDLN